MITAPGGRADWRWALLGATTLAFSFLYFVSDVLELNHGGFSTAQLALTHAAEAIIPF